MVLRLGECINLNPEGLEVNERVKVNLQQNKKGRDIVVIFQIVVIFHIVVVLTSV